MKVVVIGGGITGLATAWRLRDVAEVVVLEAADRVGGQLRTVEFAGAPFDVGADAYLARQPEAHRLAQDLGLDDDDLVPAASGQVLLWVRGRLRPLPTGTVFGVPADLAAVARSGVLTPAGLARAAAEPVVPRRRVVGDRSVADLVGERFGREVVETLVEPLLGGVYAGRTDRLSAAAALPPVWAAARRSRSLLVGVRAHRASTAAASGPVFRTVRGGMARLPEAMTSALGDRVRLRSPVRALRRGATAGWELRVGDGERVTADAVVLAVPAAAAAGLLTDVAPAAARELAAIRTASVATVALAYARGPDARLPAASGVLVPPGEGRTLKAITFATRKWPHHAERDVLLLRASVGRVRDGGGDPSLALDDDTLAERVDAEVRWAIGLPRPAVARLVQRWPDGLPQYDVGHLERVDRIRHELRQAGAGLHLGGAALDGIGVAARARDAERIVADIRAQRPSTVA